MKQFYQEDDDDVDFYELEENPNFDDDEEIDEDAAFTKEDNEKYGDIGYKRKVTNHSSIILLHSIYKEF
jgi:hypothetical protein